MLSKLLDTCGDFCIVATREDPRVLHILYWNTLNSENKPSLPMLQHFSSSAVQEPERLCRSATTAKTSNPLKLEDENAANLVTPGRIEVYQRSICVAKAHEFIFKIFHNQAQGPQTTSIEEIGALTDMVIHYAHEYDCVPRIRDALNSWLLQLDQSIYRLVSQDPPKWLLRAIKLENKVLFKESFIHLVGTLPAWPWSTPRDEIPPATLKRIVSKSKRLQERCSAFERRLLMETLQMDMHGDVRQPVEIQYCPEGWLVTARFREALISSLREIEQQHLESPLRNALHARLYRTLANNPEHVLDVFDFSDELGTVAVNFPHEFRELQQNANLLKASVAALIKEAGLLENSLLLPVEEMENAYLTCTNVSYKDFPWQVQSSTKAGSSDEIDATPGVGE